MELYAAACKTMNLSLPETAVVITCEHGGNAIPAAYQSLFADYSALLQSHRGYDPGALRLARAMAAAFDAPLFYSRVSRLVIDLNRSATSRNLFSTITRKLSPAAKRHLVETLHRPYRNRVLTAIRLALGLDLCAQANTPVPVKTVVHVACHSFTPILDGRVRNLDIGFLYDPAREAEKAFCRDWKRRLGRCMPGLGMRFNAPYRGRSDGLTTWLRQLLPQGYIGLELEINRKWVPESVKGSASAQRFNALTTAIVDACQTVVAEGDSFGESPPAYSQRRFLK